jgi:hypothetical protein
MITHRSPLTGDRPSLNETAPSCLDRFLVGLRPTLALKKALPKTARLSLRSLARFISLYLARPPLPRARPTTG